MKKLVAIVLIILLIIAILGCSNSTEEREKRAIAETQNESTVSLESDSNKTEKAVGQTTEQTSKQSAKQSKENGKRILIAYFTRADNVKQDNI